MWIIVTILLLHIVLIASMVLLLTIQHVMEAYEIEEYKLFAATIAYILCLLTIIGIYIELLYKNEL